jgi:hypothetical protein
MVDGLLPSAEVTGSVQVNRELPLEARTWGRILDLTHLEPGDLLLTRPADPSTDAVSRGIMAAQERGGFHARHAQWTHAAVYLGDDEHVCEANFKFPGYRDDVEIRSAFVYCDGKHAIRARRPKNMTQKQRLRIAIGALTNLGRRYSYTQILTFGIAAISGRGFWNSADRKSRIKTQALVCSTLYQDAYNFAFKGNTVRMGSLCTPAHLSASADFEPDDISISWLAIT